VPSIACPHMCDTARATGGLSRQCTLDRTTSSACPLPCTRARLGAWQTACAWPSVRTSHPHVAHGMWRSNLHDPNPNPNSTLTARVPRRVRPRTNPWRSGTHHERKETLFLSQGRCDTRRLETLSCCRVRASPRVVSLPSQRSAARVFGHLISVCAMMLAVTCAGEYSCHWHIAL
jgi:hypothetical protein